MNLNVIATIRDEKDGLIGVRILDSEETVSRIKDVSIQNVKDVLSSRSIEIKNIGLSEDCKNIEWTNGSMDRYPKVLNGILYGKSSCTVLYKTNGGFIVSDFFGRRDELDEKGVIKYAKEHGISNGKIISKDGKEYISSISGEYKYRDNYAGDKLDMEPLKTLVSANSLDMGKIAYSVFKYTKGEVKNMTTRTLDFSNTPDFDSEILELNKYTLAYKHITRINLDTDEDIKEFVKAYTFTLNSALQRIANEAITVGGNKQVRLLIEDDRFTNQSIRTDQEIIECIIKGRKRGVTYNIYMLHKKDLKLRTVLKRNVLVKGVEYEVAKVSNYRYRDIETVAETVEYIYKNYREYTNVTVNGNIMIIRSLDGVYRYDMDRIHSIYKRQVIDDTNKSSKAKLTGQSHKESIAKNGELQDISTTLKCVVISDKVRKICKDSIQLNYNNEYIIIGPNVVEIDYSPYVIRSLNGSDEVNIKRVEFKSQVYHKCIEEMASLFVARFKSEIVLSCEISSRQIQKLVYGLYRGANTITFANESDALYIGAIKCAIIDDVQLNKLKKRFVTHVRKYSGKMYVRDDYRRYIERVESFLEKTRTIIIPKLKNMESIEKVNSVLSRIEAQLKFRVDEVEAKVAEYNTKNNK